MTDARETVVIAAFAAALTTMASACGGGSGSCGKVQPCGGDVVGNYSITASCVNSMTMNMNPVPSCPGAVINASSVWVSGSATFTAQLTYSVNETINGSFSETIPSSCLTQQATTCAQLDLVIRDLVASEPDTFQSGHCTGSPNCTCSLTLAAQTVSESGTYTTSGTTIVLTDTGGGPGGGEYCVQGNELHLISLDTAMAMGTIRADTVLTRH